MRSGIAAALGLWLGFGALPAGAQPRQYTAPGGLRDGTKTKQEIELAMAEARWNLGPVRLAPWAGLRNLTYVGNVFASSEREVSDLTGSLGLGLTAYLPTGPKVFWVAQAHPEYVWWLDLEERRELVGRYGAGVYADLNRLGLAAHAVRVEEQAIVSSEIEQLSLARRDGVSVDVDLRLSPAIELFVQGGVTDVEDEGAVGDGSQGPPLELLGREERGLRGGVRYRLQSGLSVELGAEVAEVEFDATARDLSNRGTSPFVGVHLDGNRLDVDLELLQRSLEPTAGSDLVSVETTSGDLRLTMTPGWRFTITPYGHRSIVYTLDRDFSHFTEDRWGVAVAAPFGQLGIRLYGEGGRNDYEAITTASPGRRSEDYTGWGVGFDVKLWDRLSYAGGFHRLEYDSTLPAFDREIDRFESTVTLAVPTGSWIWQ